MKSKLILGLGVTAALLVTTPAAALTIHFDEGVIESRNSAGTLYWVGNVGIQYVKIGATAQGVTVKTPVVENGALVLDANHFIDIISFTGGFDDFSPYKIFSFDFDASSPIRVGLSGTIAAFPGNNTDTAPQYVPDGQPGFETYSFGTDGLGPLQYDVARIAAGSTIVRIDNIVLNTSIPEPATWAMMFGGFGLAGARFRRRAKVATSPVSFTA